MWNEMGIYQRCVENFVEKPVLTNQYTNNSCMNCHSFCRQNGEKWLFHQRAYYNGTYLVENDQIKKITLEKDGQASAFVYPYWHPSGKYVVFRPMKHTKISIMPIPIGLKSMMKAQTLSSMIWKKKGHTVFLGLLRPNISRHSQPLPQTGNH